MFLTAYNSFHTHEFFKLSLYSVTWSPGRIQKQKGLSLVLSNVSAHLITSDYKNISVRSVDVSYQLGHRFL